MTRPTRSLRPGPCPACDGPLGGDLVAEAEPRCPHCGLRLAPKTVAGFVRRATAALVDLIVLAATAGPLHLAVTWALDMPPPVRGPLALDTLLRWLALPPQTVVLWLVPFLGIAAFYVVLFTAVSGQTPGLMLVGARIVTARGARPGFLRALVRVIGLAAGLAPGGLGSLWIAFDREKRGLHDHLAGTYVVRTR
ncbi:MAG TPA: RDD family protein [Nannocystaceae bacterium]|nr:RDD family protein [Nannocystaceae bacterium]